jgi:hypothetical protein
MAATGGQADGDGGPKGPEPPPGGVPATAEPDGGLAVRYPPPYWLAALWCHALLLGLALLACWAPATGNSLAAYLPLLVVWGVAAVTIAANPVGRLLGRVRVESEGLRVRRRLIPWAWIARISAPWSSTGWIHVRMRRGSPVSPHGSFARKGPLSWLWRPIGPQRRRIALPAYPVVCERLLPEIVRRAPGAETTPGVRRLMESPGLAGAPVTWLVLACAWAQLTVLAYHLSPFAAQRLAGTGLIPPVGGSLILYFFGNHVMMMAGVSAATVAVPLARDARAAFVRSALASVGIAGWLSPVAAFAAFDAAWLRALWVTSVAVVLAAAAVALLGDRLQRRAEVALALAVLATALVASWPARGESWPRHDITHLFGGTPAPMMLWARDGRRMAEWTSDGRPLVIDVSTLTQVPDITARGGMVLWLDERYMLRREQDGEGCWSASLFDFRTGGESRVPTADDFGVQSTAPVCPEGRRLVWRETRAQETVLRVWDMDAKRDALDPLPLPDDPWWSGAAALWVDRDRVALIGYEAAVGGTWEPHFLEIDLRTGETATRSSQHAHELWHFSADLTRAVAGGPAGPVYRVDLASDEAVLLPGQGLVAHASPLREVVYRVIRQNRDPMLAEVHLITGETTVVCPVPPGFALEAVSDSGALALLAPAGPLEEASLVVVDLPTGRAHAVRLPGLMLGSLPGLPWTDFRGPCPFSPGDDRLLMETMGAAGLRTWLVEIPEEWRGAGAPAEPR